jgi:hypothetical protein
MKSAFKRGKVLVMDMLSSGKEVKDAPRQTHVLLPQLIKVGLIFTQFGKFSIIWG